MAPTPTNLQHRKTTSLLLSQRMDTASKAAETPLKHFNPCFAYKLQHSLYKCTVFSEISYQKRLVLITGSRRCCRCWNSHLVKNCSSKGTCKICGHINLHTLLHRPTVTKDNIFLSTTTLQNNDPTSVMIQDNVTSNVLLTTTLIPSQPLKLEKGVKRKADTTILETTYDYNNGTSVEFKSAKISTRRESCRQIKKPIRSENDRLVPYHPNNMAPRVFNAAIIPQHASHKTKEKNE